MNAVHSHLCRKHDSIRSISHVKNPVNDTLLKGEPTRVVSSSGPTSRIAAFPLKRTDRYYP